MSAPRPRAILVTPLLPSPGGRGTALRAWVWLTDMARTHEVDVVVGGDPAPLPPGWPARSVTFLAAAVRRPKTGPRLVGLLLPWTVRRHPDRCYFLAQLADPSALAGLPAGPVDRILVFRIAMHQIGRALAARYPGAERILDLDDRESRTLWGGARALLKLGRPAHALYHTLIGWQFAAIESRLPGDYHRVALAAPEDAAVLGAGFAAMESRIAAPAVVPPPGGSRLLFVGTLNYAPNEEAVQFLLTRVVPALRRRGIEPAIDIVGRSPTARLAAQVKSVPGARLFADAADLAPHYAEALAVLVPLRFGGGTKLKSIEAFAHARPVISTRHGMRGLAAIAGEHYLGAETPEEFAAAIAQLTADPALAARIGAAGHQLWQERYRL